MVVDNDYDNDMVKIWFEKKNHHDDDDDDKLQWKILEAWNEF